MRDGQIMQMNQATARNVFQLLKSVANLEARQKALEQVLTEMNSMMGFKSEDLIQRVNKIHRELVEKFNQNLKESAQNAQEEAKKPKLTIVPAGVKLPTVALILFVLGMVGCSRETVSRISGNPRPSPTPIFEAYL